MPAVVVVVVAVRQLGLAGAGNIVNRARASRCARAGLVLGGGGSCSMGTASSRLFRMRLTRLQAGCSEARAAGEKR